MKKGWNAVYKKLNSSEMSNVKDRSIHPRGMKTTTKKELVCRSVKDEFNNNKKVEKKLKREFYYGKGMRI